MAEIPELRVGECMTTRIVSVGMDDSLRAVREIFEHVRFHHLLVIEHGRLMGVVSDTDFLEATSPNLGRAAETTRDLATLNKRVHQIMTRHPETIRRDATLADAIRRFDESGVSFLPVLNDDETVAGVLSWRDIIRALVRGGEGGAAGA